MINEFEKFCASHCCAEDCKNQNDYCPIAEQVRSIYGGCPGGDKCENVFQQNRTSGPLEEDTKVVKKFNPFYDSDFLISREGSEEKRMLVELYKNELLQLRSEIDAVLEHLEAFEGIAEGA